jgi:hypothetical protein
VGGKGVVSLRPLDGFVPVRVPPRLRLLLDIPDVGQAPRDQVQVLFADTRPFAEYWTYRFLAAALSDADSSDPA